MVRRTNHLLPLLVVILLVAGGCQKAYYMAWEKVGKEKRHLLRDQVEKAQTEQQEASEQFETVLDRIKALYGFEGGELEKFYKALKSDFDECEQRADTVRDRVAKVERIAADLFAEWETEITEITNVKLQNNSRRSLADARKRYAKLEKAMRRAEGSMTPVLNDLRDYVLYLKHNLNAQAISALKGEVGEIEVEVAGLVADMQRSIAAAQEFLKKI